MNGQVALYARVSSERQAEDGTIQSQLAALKEYAKGRLYALRDELLFIDNGVSGATLVRPELDRLRDAAASGVIDKVLVLCPDRLAQACASADSR